MTRLSPLPSTGPGAETPTSAGRLVAGWPGRDKGASDSTQECEVMRVRREKET